MRIAAHASIRSSACCSVRADDDTGFCVKNCLTSAAASSEQKFPVEVTGIYRHTFTRTEAGWRSRKLHETVLWRRGFEALGM